MSGFSLRPLLGGLVAFCARHAGPVVVAALVIAVAGGWVTWGHFGVSTRGQHVFALHLPWRQRQAAFDRDFPQFQNLLVAVVNGRTPEQATATAAALAQALRAGK